MQIKVVLSMKASWRLKLMFTSVPSPSIPTYMEVQNCLTTSNLTELCCHEAAYQSSSCSFSLVSPYFYFWCELGVGVVTESRVIWTLKRNVWYLFGIFWEKRMFLKWWNLRLFFFFFPDAYFHSNIWKLLLFLCSSSILLQRNFVGPA